MLRRPPTYIELKLDDIREYEYMRQQMVKDQEKQSKSFSDAPPPWTGTSKTKEEVFSRIGYVPSRPEPMQAPRPIM